MEKGANGAIAASTFFVLCVLRLVAWSKTNRFHRKSCVNAGTNSLFLLGFFPAFTYIGFILK